MARDRVVVDAAEHDRPLVACARGGGGVLARIGHADGEALDAGEDLGAPVAKVGVEGAAAQHEGGEEVADAGQMAALKRYAVPAVEHRRVHLEGGHGAIGKIHIDREVLAIGAGLEIETVGHQTRTGKSTGGLSARRAARDDGAEAGHAGGEVKAVAVARIRQVDIHLRDVDAADGDHIAGAGLDLSGRGRRRQKRQGEKAGKDGADHWRGLFGRIGNAMTLPCAGAA